MHFTYIVKCADGTLYCGWTTDLAHRLAAHNSGTGAKYTRSRRPVQLIYYEQFDNKSDALKREAAIKRLPREQKLALFMRASGEAEQHPLPGIAGGHEHLLPDC